MCRFENTLTAAQAAYRKLPAEVGGSGSELAAENMAEMRMTGEAKVQRKHSEIRLAIREMFQCVA
jgi:hypothetical protein